MAVLKSYQIIPIEKYHETIELPQEIDINLQNPHIIMANLK